MPKHGPHRYTDKLVFGKPFGEVHRLIDQPYIWLGRKHRILFHTYEEAYIMGSLATSDPRGGLAGLLHVWVDEQCSKDKVFRKWLEFSAKQDALWQKKMRRWKKLLKKRRR